MACHTRKLLHTHNTASVIAIDKEHIQTWSMRGAGTRAVRMKINGGRANLSAAATTAASVAAGAALGEPRPTAAGGDEMCGGDGGEADGKGEGGVKNGHEHVGGDGGGRGAAAARATARRP